MAFRTAFTGLGLLAAGLLLAAGCDQGPSNSLTAPGMAGPKAALARLMPAEPCADLLSKPALVREMLDAVNAERARHKLRPLKTSSTLAQIADFYACRLVDGGFFGHDDPFDGSTVDVRAANFGYAFVKIGENLAAGQLGVQETLADWLASPGHRANLLDPAFTEIGMAVKTGGEFGTYWVQEFGRPLTSLNEPVASPAEGSTSPDQSRPNASQPTP